MASLPPESFSAVRDLRRKRGLSIRDLATKAGVSTNSVLRVERGLPTTLKVREKVANALTVTVERLSLTDCIHPSPYAFHSLAATRWMPRGDLRRGQAKAGGDGFVDCPAERRRLGRTGLVTSFMGILRCGLEEGRTLNALLELYGPPAELSQHPGEEFVYCTQGRVRLRIGDDFQLLGPGDSATFLAEIPHAYEPLEGDPAILLCVCMDAPGLASPKSLTRCMPTACKANARTHP
jgi:transcriptional regulator with XRE-family HTH domain